MPTIDGPPSGPEVHYFDDATRDEVLASRADSTEVVEPETKPAKATKKARKKT